MNKATKHDVKLIIKQTRRDHDIDNVDYAASEIDGTNDCDVWHLSTIF